MAVISTGNSSLDNITASYQSNQAEKASKEDALGRDTFLTMLVAQLQNQDPLNPMDGTDFSAQLAQFSQLEQLINLNDSMEMLANSFTENSEGDVMGYLGKQVTGKVDSMNVSEGTVSGGFYNLAAPADVMITITDADGKTIKTLYEGQQGSGSHLIAWDGTNTAGEAVEDGTYKYTVMAHTGYGFAEIPSTITGNVEGITYNNGKPYLVVQGVLLDPNSLTAVIDLENNNGSISSESALDYLGKTITSGSPIVLMENGSVYGDELGFQLDTPEDAIIKIYDANDQLVRTMSLPAEDTDGGEISIHWDGMGDSGYKMSDGLYYYTVTTDSGYVQTPLSEVVSGIKYVNDTQYLVLSDSGRLVSLSNITGIN